MAVGQRDGDVDCCPAGHRGVEVQMKRSKGSLATVLIAGVLLLAGCGEEVKPNAQEITGNTFCALDGMLLLDYPGPKAQIHYDQGSPEFFCDTVEMFSIYTRPEQEKRILAVYVQDMGKADWTKPLGHWINAETAFYVGFSRRNGSMGPTLASFAREEDAREFIKQYGGELFRFDQVTPEMTTLDGGVLNDEGM
ncbi:MAG TPA: nitrous oxide reductase accessory protein NosL [Candidatus Contendobacter sp.]|nr:nitrous oxide reductase accessory protein NosL [Candidatus Contendobacter sp.]